ncbi:cytochrome c nitrite reductase small subunit [Campylobacterota bacterium]|nr:cytochrome c nitrite reductase small subunit [Campylobacterota bacterium]
MGQRKLLVVSALGAFIVAIGVFCYTLSVSKAFSYLSDDPKACINCHVMNTQYATWEHGAHGKTAACVSCHLPDKGIEKYIAKARDGFNHAYAFTFNTYDQAITISEDGASRVQANCVACHAEPAKTVLANASRNHTNGFSNSQEVGYCWSCHRETPHGTVRALATTPNTLGVRYVK